MYEQTSSVYENPGVRGGVYTLDLNQEIELNPDAYFSVVLEATNQSNDAEFLFSYEANSTNDLTFFYEDNKWTNSADDSYKVAAVKAMTKTSARDNNDKNLAFAQITPNKSDYEYQNQIITPDINVTFDQQQLILNSDYEIQTQQIIYKNHFSTSSNEIGKLILTIKPKTNSSYTGAKTIALNIIKANNPVIENNLFNKYGQQTNTIEINVNDTFSNQIYNYSQITLPQGWVFEKKDMILKDGFNQDNKLIYNQDDKIYYKNIKFNVKVIKNKQKNSLDQLNIDKINDIYYTGNEIKPKLHITFNNSTLIENVDYTVEYQDNVKTGNAKIII